MNVLESLQDQSFITSHKKGNYTVYKVTEKGKNVLKYFSEAMNLIEIK
jgi:predicted transcriptional regulator